MYRTLEIPALRALTGPIDRVARRAHVRPEMTDGRQSAWRSSLTLVAAAALVITAALVVMMMLIRTRSASGAELRALLDDPACTAPCWARIVPGVTSAGEAMAILETHPWIAQVHRSLDKISFWWNGQQPTLFDDTGRAFHGRLELQLIDGVERVSSIVLATRADLGTMQLELGQPETLTLHAITGGEDTRAGVVHVAHYPALGITAFNLLHCPLSVTDFWHAPAVIAFGEPVLAFPGEKIDQSTSRLPDGFFAGRAPFCG
ncbi:MAG: hypothetical protein NZM00_07000 [Anaerolinea sp.]|nr:hypothetical protein [Anaerolinea sp.]